MMRFSLYCFTALMSGALAVVSSSCAGSSTARSSARPQPKLYDWHDDGGEGEVTIRISLSDQIAEYKRGGRPIGWSYVATGKPGHGTPGGSFKITEKVVDKYSNRYGWFEDEFGNVVDGDASSSDAVPAGLTYVAAPMPYWMRLTNYGIGMHGGLIPQPGLPASHGCIRLPKPFAPVLFDAIKVGTPVTITSAPATQGPMAPAPYAADPTMSPAATIQQAPANKRPERMTPAAYRGEGRVISSRPLTSDDLRHYQSNQLSPSQF